MDKLKKNELLNLCKSKGLKVNQNMNKETLRNILQQGGRYYKCFKDSKTKFIQKSTNPQFSPGSYRNWICQETGLTNNKNKKGCSMGLKEGLKCIPCTPGKNQFSPKICRGCVKGKNVYYCS